VAAARLAVIGSAVLSSAAVFFVTPIASTSQQLVQSGATGSVTYAKDVAPILQHACQDCHRARNGRPGLPTYSRMPNKPPEISIASASHAATVEKPFTLTVAVRDDGVFEPSREGDNTAVQRLEVIWTPYRGPGTVDFRSRRSPVTVGRATNQMTFGSVGTYVLRISPVMEN
jgi:hypothetical protein